MTYTPTVGLACQKQLPYFLWRGLGFDRKRKQIVHRRDVLAVTHTLANLVSKADLKQGSRYPALPPNREVLAQIAAAVADVAYQRGLAGGQAPNDTIEFRGPWRGLLPKVSVATAKCFPLSPCRLVARFPGLAVEKNAWKLAISHNSLGACSPCLARSKLAKRFPN